MDNTEKWCHIELVDGIQVLFKHDYREESDEYVISVTCKIEGLSLEAAYAKPEPYEADAFDKMCTQQMARQHLEAFQKDITDLLANDKVQ